METYNYAKVTEHIILHIEDPENMKIFILEL